MKPRIPGLHCRRLGRELLLLCAVVLVLAADWFSGAAFAQEKEQAPNPGAPVSAAAGVSAPDLPAAKGAGDKTDPPAGANPVPVKDGYAVVAFDVLASYNFEVPDGPLTGGNDAADAQIPERVKAFDRKKVSITGFMLPLKVESGAVTEFLIMRDQSMCCYGTVPKITEWVSVKTPGKGVKSIMDQPVTIFGTLRVGAMRENGYLIGIYAMDGEKLVGPADN